MKETPLYSFLTHFLSQLEASGVKAMVVAPGSRSTPLAVLARTRSAIRVYMALDERSAGYFAYGLAKASAAPVALLCTSGTASANFFPAVQEASLSRVPLIVLTADRPRELRDVGAAQTVNQVNLYGPHVKWFQDLPTPHDDSLNRYAAQVAARAVHRATMEPSGPVHLNFPFREPLLPGEGPAATPLMGSQWAPQYQLSPQGLSAALEWIRAASRPVIALGPEAPFMPQEVRQHLLEKGWPVFADPLNTSGRPPGLLTTYDAFLRAEPCAPEPDLVIHLGAYFTSKSFNQWASHARLILIDWPTGFRDPDHRTSLVLEGDPGHVISELTKALPALPTSWTDLLTAQQERAAVRTAVVLHESPPNFEGRFYHYLDQLLGPRDIPILVASSMPVRDFDTYYIHGKRVPFANRGVNGIDGLNSTALGISAHFGDVLAIVGDLAFHHDLNGLHLAQLHHLNALFILMNNQGGAIFSYLSQSQLPPDLFEELFGTPHHIDFSGVRTLYGATYRRATTFSEFEKHFEELLGETGLRVLEWNITNRTDSVIWHRRIYNPKGGAL